MKRIISAAAVLLTVFAVFSCQKDDTLYYGNMTMGNIVDGRFVSDMGNVFNVVETLDTCHEQLDTMNRAIIVCDVLRETKGAEKEYDVRLNSVSSVVAKAPVSSESISTDVLQDDPIYLNRLWFSGGYMNMLLKFPSSGGKDVRHIFTLIYTKDEEGEYVFDLLHDASGDLWDGASSSVALNLAYEYVSFRISDIIENDSAPLIISYKWYRNAGDAWSSEIEDYRIGYTWKRDAFERVPASL